MANIYDMADTWNDAGTTFTGIKMDVTDTASSASSLLMDLQVGGSSKFQVGKDGRVTIPSSSSAGIYTDGAFPAKLFMVQGFNPGTGFLFAGHNSVAPAYNMYMEGSGEWTFRARASATFSWTDSSSAGAGSRDLILARDAANTLAQRNSTNAQTFNLYNTYTDASNYERARMGWNANVFEIAPQSAGTGTTRVLHISGLPTANPGPGILWNDAGTVKVGT